MPPLRLGSGYVRPVSTPMNVLTTLLSRALPVKTSPYPTFAENVFCGND